jgi:poly(3-hydroxybutyrate) depolymerase
MVSGKNLATVLTAILLTACAASSAPQARGDTFTETYTDPALGESKRLSVFVARPRRCRAAHGETVLIVMHGLLRQGEKTRDDWVSLAQRHCLTVLVPEFDAQRFPTQLYQSGGVDQTADRERWTFSVIDRLFDALNARLKLQAKDYVLYGHSAGAQFAHRAFLLGAVPKARLIVSANAGYYTWPVLAGERAYAPFPFTLAGTPVSPDDLNKRLQQSLLILLGENDTDPQHEQLNNTAEAKVQGIHRVARGERFLLEATRSAKENNVPLTWQVIKVAGAGHENTKMAAFAANVIAAMAQRR